VSRVLIAGCGYAGLDAVVYAISPAGRTAEAYRLAYVEGLENLLDAVSAPVRTVLVSSTGVYGHTDGRWVDEETPEDPSDPTAELVRAGEAVARSRGAPGVVVRLGGIYGPGRTRTNSMVKAGEAPCMSPRHVLRLRDPAPVYLGVDRDPAPLRDVYAWIADRGRAPDPCAGVEPDEAGVGGRRGTNKRCSSRRLQDSGYAFRYPTFREGYAPLVGKELAG
jgi:nucleoside-diphosphate-sugar epimerase